MDGIPWQNMLAITGIAIPVVAFMWEFVLVGRKRIGYRVQMDTTPTDLDGLDAGAWRRLERENGTRLRDPSFVLLRVENIGTAPLGENDYASPERTDVGITVRFPGRRVAGYVVTELSDDDLESFFSETDEHGKKRKVPGMGMRNAEESGRTVGVVDLPKVKLNRADYYKVLVVLERPDKESKAQHFEDPVVLAAITGGVGRGRIHKTESRTGTPRRIVAIVSLLAMIAFAEPFVIDRITPDAAPLDCASGRLTITGSTAFGPVLREAADSYHELCPASSFSFDLHGSAQGLDQLSRSKSKDMLAFSDGPKGALQPALLPRPIAFVLFTLVVSKDAGVEDLTLDQVKSIFGGKVTNWRELGGNDLPVRIIDRESDSGTRSTFEQRVLGTPEPGENSNDCLSRKPGTPTGEVVRCRRSDTGSLLDAVASTPGGVGYSELGTAAGRKDLLALRIDGQAASLDAADHGAYPFWQTEYAYTYSEADSSSLAASFIRFMTQQLGQDIIRSHGDRPCAELANPVLCQPS